MKIAILGGTGKMGMALAGRLAGANEVIIGSRDPARAREPAKKIQDATGKDYEGASKEADVVESVTVLVLNLASLNQTGSLTTKFVSRKD